MLSTLIEQIKKTYNGKAWHGPNMMESIADLSLPQLSRRIGDSHNIAELAHHLYAWRFYVIQQLKGVKDFKVKDDFNFRKIDRVNQEDWEQLKQQLDTSQLQLIDALENFDEPSLLEKIPVHDYTYLELIHGIIHHDLYHIGQIVLLKKLEEPDQKL